MGVEDFEVGLGRRMANFTPLTPLVFLDWSADVYPEHLAVVHGARRYSWSATRDLLVDRAFSGLAARAVAPLDRPPVLVDVDDSEYTGPGERIGIQEYESLRASADPRHDPDEPADEWQAISLNYTSGTTGNPKGVVVHHRGAHLNAVGNILTWDMPRHSVYLWTLPMFHCNGWCFPWTMAANAGTNVCLRTVEAAALYRLIAEHRVTHYCGAPIGHNLLIDAPPELRATLDHELHAMVAGAPPPARTFEGAEGLGIDLTHVYGLTEVYGPAAVCASTPRGRTWMARPARGATGARASVTCSRTGSPSSTPRPAARCRRTARRSARSSSAATSRRSPWPGSWPAPTISGARRRAPTWICRRERRCRSPS